MSASDTFANFLEGSINKFVPESMRETALLRAFGFWRVPVLFFISPSVTELTDQRSVVRIPLNRRTKNHLNSMYFGVLAAGADCAGGLVAMKAIRDSGEKVNLIFKDFKADFLKRAEGDTLFTCEDGEKVAEMVQKAVATGERQNMPVNVVATVPSKFGDEPVAKFVLTLSLKKK